MNGEIALGFFLATIFWIAVVGWATSYMPTTQEKEACYQGAAKAGRDTRECESFWEKTTSEPIALFTLVLAFSTVGLWVATFGLYIAGERHSERQLRAYVMIDAVDIENVVVGGCPVAKLTIKNYGQTPASNLTHWARMGFFAFPLNTQIPERSTEMLPPRPLGPGAVVHVFTGINNPLNVATRAAIARGSHALYVRGEIRYDDAFGKPRETDFLAFCRGDIAARGAMASYDTGNRIT